MSDAEFYESVKESDFCGESSSIGNDIIDALGLSDFFPEKITFKQVRQHKHDKDMLIEIKWILISKLIGLNAKARDLELEPILKKHASKSSTEGSHTDFNDFLANLLAEEFSDKICKTVTFHPLDIFLAVFSCCSPFLKQLIISKMFTCRLAVPLISMGWINIGSPKLWSWPLRGISIEGMSKDQKAIQISLMKSELKVVSFIRLGRPSMSKSKLMNEVLTNQYYDTFFNKDCPLGTASKSISNGLIEASWFLPEQQESSVFSDVIMFLNLRGDGNDYLQQRKMLQKISSVVIIIVESNELSTPMTKTVETCMQMHTSGVFVLYAIHCNPQQTNLQQNIKSFMHQVCCTKVFYKEWYFITITTLKGSSDVREGIRNVIRRTLKEKHQTTLENIMEDIKSFRVTSDETSSSCTVGKSKAELVMKGIRNKKKKDICPLQNTIWLECTKVVKQQRKASEALKPQQIDKMEQQLKALRMAQHKKGNELSSALKLFISTLVELEDSSEEMQYFLCYLKTSLDEMSRFNLLERIHTYQTKWKKWQSDKGIIKDPKTVGALKMEVDKAEIELAGAHFGYEHLIRELGQLFECTKRIGPLVDTELIKSIPRCPKLIAKQLLLGQPFEIMDGDAANVPTTWVNAVFQELQNIVGDAKVLSISVLGNQSSGKSTLLNTMFGLQFAVSAGRCTRGVFLQILPLPANKYPFEYLLVIDTEGLRAPELSDLKHEHDNMMATFVIGLGDVTIINVKGENATEVNDVLQIAVHAFLRLKLAARNSIQLYQSCIFVHQNVPGKDAKEKLMHGRKKFVENLDIMTKEAAAQENMFHISSFNQVMDFDSEDHVFYFSDLWYGDPPMAPVNQGYSTNVETLEGLLFPDVKKRETYLTLSDTRQRMLDLWEGILTEDFVFSFRNTLEVKAYNSVETIFQELKWELEKHVFYLVFSSSENKYACCKTIEKCETVHTEIERQLQRSIASELKRLIEISEEKLRKNPWKEIVLQWKESKINRLKCFADEQESQALRELKTLKEKYILMIKKNVGLSQAESRILFEKAKDIADKLQGKQASNHQLKVEFDKMLASYIEEFKVKQNVETVPIKEQIRKALLECNHSDAIFLKNISERIRKQDYKTLTCLNGSLRRDDIMDEYIGVQPLASRSVSLDRAKTATLYITNEILESIDVYMNHKKTMNMKFNILYMKKIFMDIESFILYQNTIKQNPFSLSKPYKAMMQWHVSKYAEHAFTRINDRYEEINGLQRKINDYKETLWRFFIARVEQRSEEISLGIQVCKVLSEVVISTVSKFLPIDVESRILKDFAHTKFNLMTKILHTLATKEDFSLFSFYISNSKQFTEKWIENYSEKKIFSSVSPNGMTMYALLAKLRMDEIFKSLQNAIESAETTTSKQKDISIDKWMVILTSALDGCLTLSDVNFAHIAYQHVSDLQSFTAHLISELPKLQQECLDLFLRVNSSNVDWYGRNPYTSMASKLWGCPQCCPFCLEPCQKSDERHFEFDKTDVHTCIQHRPVGVIGGHIKSTNKMIIKVCNFEVQSKDSFYCSASHYQCRESGKCDSKENNTTHLYREYKDVLPSWDIAPSNSIHSSDFWSWYVCKYVNQLCQRYSMQPPDDIPETWLAVTKEEALDSLRKALA